MSTPKSFKPYQSYI
jgi:hypothetical protein